MIPIVILAGGKSSRMGKDKALLPFGKFESLTEYQYERLKKEFDRVYISSKIDKFNFLPKDSLLLDDNSIFAPTVAISSTFKKLSDDKIFFISVDTPFVKIETIKSLMCFDLSIAKSEYLEPLCAIYNRSISQTLDNMIENDNHKLKYLIDKFDFKICEFDSKEFINLNHIEEYNRYYSSEKS